MSPVVERSRSSTRRKRKAVPEKPPTPAKPSNLPKPYYQDGAVTIYQGDCREVMPGLVADVVVTDPPYGIGFPYLSYQDTRESLSALIADVMPQVRGKMRRAIILCGPTQIAMYPEANWVSCVTWNTTGSFGRYGYSQWTPVLCYGADLDGFGNVNGMTKSDTLRINGGGGVGFRRDDSEAEHTCPKPMNMMRLVVARFTSSSETILDPFMGIGTTLVAAKDLGRKAIGIEIEERYCEIAARRCAQEVLFTPPPVVTTHTTPKKEAAK